MNTAEFIKVLEQKNIPYTVNGKWVCVYGGSVFLNSLASISDNVKFENGGYVYLNSLTTLSDNVKFENSGGVYLGSLTTLSDNVKFENGGGVYLGSLTTLSNNVKFENGSGVYLGSLTTLSDNVKFENSGGVYLGSLTTLSNNVKFENGGNVYLDSLTSPFQIYCGQQIELRNIDGFTMLITSKRALGEYEIYKAKFFGGGDIKDLDDCYIAESGGVYAHDSTAKEAFEDLNFKLAERAGKKDIIDRVKKSQQVTVEDFRVLTGACREGIRKHLLSHKIDIDQIESMSLDDALGTMIGTSYGEIFKSELEGNV